MKLLKYLGISALAIAGCHTARMPYLGHWEGTFVVTTADQTPPDRATELAWKGYLQLYKTNDNFVMELKNRSQTLTLTGTWKLLRPSRIEIDFKAFTLDQPPLEKMVPMDVPFLPSEDLHAAYGKPMVFDLSADGKTLTGLQIRVGPLHGHHQFMKMGF